MRDALFRLTFVAILTFIVVVLSIGLWQKSHIAEFVRVNFPQWVPGVETEVELGCPASLAVYHFVDIKDKKSFDDDDVFIAIISSDDKSYKAEVFVNGVSEGTVTITGQKTALKSKLITEWWREGMIEETSQEEEKEDSTEEKTQNKKTFYIDVAIQGCNKTIATLTPTLPSVTPTLGGSGGGGSDSSDSIPSSRYSISISKSQPFYLPD